MIYVVCKIVHLINLWRFIFFIQVTWLLVYLHGCMLWRLLSVFAGVCLFICVYAALNYLPLVGLLNLTDLN